MAFQDDGIAMRVLVGISGASGAMYGVRVLEALASQPDVEVHLIITPSAGAIVEDETGRDIGEVADLADKVWDDGLMESPLASGSFPMDAMAVVPCSVSTVAKIASGVGDTLLTRAAAVSLKERRRLVVVAREMPLSTIDLRNLTTLSEAGAVVAVASPPFDTGPEPVEDMVDPGPLLMRYEP